MGNYHTLNVKKDWMIFMNDEEKNKTQFAQKISNLLERKFLKKIETLSMLEWMPIVCEPMNVNGKVAMWKSWPNKSFLLIDKFTLTLGFDSAQLLITLGTIKIFEYCQISKLVFNLHFVIVLAVYFPS
jgi:hypothetical protein